MSSPVPPAADAGDQPLDRPLDQSPETSSLPRVYFSGRDDRGHLVTLRMPVGSELLCGGCAAHQALALGPVATPYATGASFDVVEPLDAIDMLYPGPGQPGHDCSTAFPGPVWLVSQDGCELVAGAHVTRAAGSPGGEACGCGWVSFLEALRHLDQASRNDAAAAHLEALGDVQRHLRAAEAVAEGYAGAEHLDVACLACLTDPDFHVSELEDDLAARTLELAPVTTAYATTLRIGPRRAAEEQS